jgi:pimeloyl-ACP methyl ester carboxylesterase
MTTTSLTQLVLATLLANASTLFPAAASENDKPSRPSFAGEASSWHGYDRFDFLMDEQTLAIESSLAAAEARSGLGPHIAGKRRCVVVVPKSVAPGNPWSWRGCYWDHQPQTEIELLKRGFHIAYIEATPELRPGRHWDAWYTFLTEKHGFSPKPAFVGMSRGGEFSYTWATTHPDKVSCIYADNTGGNWDVLMKLAALATNDVPLLHVCGSIDPILGRFTLPMEAMYQQFGGRISAMIKEGRGHHPHSLRNPTPIADFIEQSVRESRPTPPSFAGDKFSRNWFYRTANIYREYPGEGTFITLRGPQFTDCYERYQVTLPGVEGSTTVIVPKKAAAGNPWVFRADLVSRDAVVDQALLEKGFHIVTGAVPFNADGPILAQWNAIYNHLVAHGFSKKPVLEGAGGAAGEAYSWAIANPEKVSCIYAENPVLHSNLAKTQPLEDLAALAKAGVPILHVSGDADPGFSDNTRKAEERYKQLGGKFVVMVNEGQGHYPLSPKDPAPVLNFITNSVK